jgi:hypothetical protein
VRAIECVAPMLIRRCHATEVPLKLADRSRGFYCQASGCSPAIAQCSDDNCQIQEKEWQILDDFVKASSLVTAWFRRLACVRAL